MKDKIPSLLVDLYELTMASSYLDYKPNAVATFDLFIRQFPQQRGYFIAAGLGDCINYLENLNFGNDALKYLKSLKLFPRQFLDYLSKFKFEGEVWALPEGTIVFPEEPILRIKAPLIEAQIIESALLNIINLQVTMATKASRVVYASGNKPIFDFSLRRTQGISASQQTARCSYIAGCAGTSNVLAGNLYGIPVTGTMAHSFVMSFANELESFRAFAKSFPEKTILLIDTYNAKEGLRHAIVVAKEMERKEKRLFGIRLDSGNLLTDSKKMRNILNNEGLSYVKIVASGNLDEYKIKELVHKGAKIDSFGVGTHMGTSSDMPYSDVIYKLSAITDSKGKLLPTMKLSQAKRTFPGIKQVWRRYDAKGMFKEDILSLDAEIIRNADKLLIKVMDKGKRIYKSPSLTKIRQHCLNNLKFLPEQYKQIEKPDRYPVTTSLKLKNLTNKVGQKILQQQLCKTN